MPWLPTSLGDKLRGEECFSGPRADDRYGGIVGGGLFLVDRCRISSLPPHRRILGSLTNSHLYVANPGAPLTKNGIVALLGAQSSRKRKTQIGRFGLGFKSLLALGGKIDLFSRSVSIRFDPEACQNTISDELK